MKWRVNELIAEHRTLTGNKLTYRIISEGANLSANSVALIVSGKASRAELASLDKLLNYFSAVMGRVVEPGELFYYDYDGEYAIEIGLPPSVAG